MSHLELHDGGTSLLLGLEVGVGGVHASGELVEAGVSRRHGEGSSGESSSLIVNGGD